MFLPAYVDYTKAVEYFELDNKDATLTINGTEIVNGQSNAVISGSGEYLLKVGDNIYNLTIISSKNVPSLFIKTESGTLDYIHKNKENKEAATICVYENGQKEIDSDLKQIKGRGNATWEQEKKPYNIKFDSKTSLLGMKKAKKWTLLACTGDVSLTENALGWYLSNALGLPYTCDYRIVDLFINNNYLGTYIACESVEVGDNRIKINDLDKANENANPDVNLDELQGTGNFKKIPNLLTLIPGSKKWVKIPNNPEDISGGYLMEFDVLDRYMAERSGFVTTTGQCVVLKSPENATKSEVNYIYSIVNPAFEALYSDDGYNKKGKHYSEYFDLESMIKMYIIQELTANLDACLTSFYMVKPEHDDKLYFYPVWDLDNAFSTHGRFSKNTEIKGTDFWWTNSVYEYKTGINLFLEKPLFYNQAFRHEDFRKQVELYWTTCIENGSFSDIKEHFNFESNKYIDTSIMNAIRWNLFNTDDCSSCGRIYLESVNSILNFIDSRVNSLSKGFSDDSAMLYYDANGGLGWLYQPQIMSVGESCKVLDAYNYESLNLLSIDYTRIVPSRPTKRFDGWNTKPNGSGTTYYPGDVITLNSRTTTLYAQWKNACKHEHRFTEKVVAPTDTKYGYTIHTCGTCKLFYKNNFKKPLKK